MMREVLAARRDMAGDSAPDTLLAMNNLAVILHMQGEVTAGHCLIVRVHWWGLLCAWAGNYAVSTML